MNSIPVFTNSLTGEISSKVRNGIQIGGEWISRAVKFVENIPQQMQRNSTMTSTVFLAGNIIFFILGNKIAQAIPLKKKNIRNILLREGLITGISVLAGNIGLSRLTRYPLSKAVMGIVTITAVVARILLSLRDIVV